MYRRKLIGFAIASMLTLLSVAIAVVWSSRVTANHIKQISVSNALLAEHLQLSSTSYRLFKQLTDEILLDEQANQSKVREKRTQVAESIGRISVLQAQQRQALGSSYMQQTVRGIERLETIVDEIIEGFEAAASIDDPKSDAKVRLVLEERIDIAFREAVNAAVDRQRSVVSALSDRIESIHQLIFWGSAVLALIAATLTLFGVLWLMRSMMVPVDALKRAARSVADGDFNYRAPHGFDAEFDEIATGFNLIADRLTELNTAREQTQQALEHQVNRRTAELTEANAALKKSDEVRRSFLADVSHELRTPLTVIRGEAQVALRRTDRDANEYLDALACVLEQSISLSHLVDDLLFVARADSSSLRLDRQAVDIGPLLYEVARDLRALGDEQQIVLEVRKSDPMSLVGDPKRLRQLFLILMENAIRYSSSGGSVTVVTTLLPEQAEICVEDHGYGIDARDLPFVFERFYRGSGDKEGSRPAGMGLGLSVARAIVEAHGGGIKAESEVGKGTTIRVTLPLRISE